MKTNLSVSRMRILLTASVLCCVSALSAADACCAAANPYVGRWALTIPGGRAGWLGVEQLTCGALKGSILWGGGSVVPVAETRMENGALLLTRKHNRKKEGKEVQHIETITARREGNALALLTRTADENGKELSRAEFTGVKIPDLPSRPDLSKLRFGTPVALLARNDLSGWKVMNEKAPNCWSVKDGVLSNRVAGPDGKNRHGTNIRTEAEFEDFNLKTEVRVPKGGNSGIYLRGIYEVQVAETYGRPVNPHNMGALYSRITPAIAAEKPAGEWQTFDITLVDRHLTVILNGKTIIDNQPVLGCTGGAMTSDEFRPGPIYLQGDHTDVDYRNMVITPIVK
ncbi:MAG TPA: DUF1080 domain-containing protein [Kiritimatiellia bacterium]|nr:DUF1080 domain-containing protein [Kiritimatiellia bacterium]HRU20064.1 DUF1080 domain-containing protein [Kiritimatiellia bacterium]